VSCHILSSFAPTARLVSGASSCLVVSARRSSGSSGAFERRYIGASIARSPTPARVFSFGSQSLAVNASAASVNGSTPASRAAARTLLDSAAILPSAATPHRCAKAAWKRASSISTGSAGSVGHVARSRSWCAGFGSTVGAREVHGRAASATLVPAKA
jgi:hypothetical protein